MTTHFSVVSQYKKVIFTNVFTWCIVPGKAVLTEEKAQEGLRVSMKTRVLRVITCIITNDHQLHLILRFMQIALQILC